MKAILVYLILIITAVPAFSQKQLEKQLSGQVAPEEIITLSENIPFDQAIGVMSGMSERLTGKKIVSTVNLTTPIGIEIDRMPYMKALLIIVQYNNLIYEERETVIVVKSKVDPASLMSSEVYAPVNSREVKISAIFFEANTSEFTERGINWEWLLSKDGFNVGSAFRTFAEEREEQENAQTSAAGQQATERPPDFTIGPKDVSFAMGDWDGTATALFKFFETEELGEIIASPSIKVRDKNKGRIQIGSDISIKQKDFAGNVTDVFISTGTIIEVIPHLYSEDGVDYVLLKIDVERSSATPGQITTEIFKQTASTEVLMLNGEETVIGGLFVNEDISTRRGIPFLKDLPWWVFGIRYLTGYDAESTSKKEVVILIKTEIIPTLKERLTHDKVNVIKEEIKSQNAFIENYKFKAKSDDSGE
jgi:type IV pilus assembly protein PilQ